MDEETMGGTIGSVPEETPSPTPTPTETPTETGEPGQPTGEPTEELFELPDGRKVDAETLSKEWKENFYPDYTRKSQELSGLKNNPASKPTETLPNNQPTEYYKDPNWQPTSYADLIEAAKLDMKNEFVREQKEAEERRQGVEDYVSGQLTELKTADPNLNENALFVHATKYGFSDLKAAYANMKDMAAVVKTTQKQTADNIQKRNDPVSAVPGASGARSDPSSFSSAVEYLRSLNK